MFCTFLHTGLYHPFENGCSEPNDFVDDTAQEQSPQFGCPNPAPETCPNKPSNQPKLDPIHSYMDYSPDACMNLFTPGQITRMSIMWVSEAFREIYYIHKIALHRVQSNKLS